MPLSTFLWKAQLWRSGAGPRSLEDGSLTSSLVASSLAVPR